MADPDIGELGKSFQRLRIHKQRRKWVYIAYMECDDNETEIYFKVSWTGVGPLSHRQKLNSGNPHQLKIETDSEIEVKNGRVAKAAVKEALKLYSYRAGGGRDWFRVELNEWDDMYKKYHKTLSRFAVHSSFRCES